MKTHFALVAAVMTMAAVATAAQPPIYVSFDAPYTAAGLIGQQGWTTSGSTPSTVNPITVGATGLSYAGYVTAGGSVFLTDTGEDLGLSFDTALPAADGNTYYFSLLLAHDGTDVGNATGDYFAHLTGGTDPTSGNFRGRLFGRAGTTATDLELGLRYGSGDTIQWSGVNVPANTTAFVAVKITEVAGTTIPSGTTGNDTAQLFITIAPNAIPGTEPAAVVTATNLINSNQEIQDAGQAIGRFGLRQGNAAAGAKVTVDEIRIGTTWADIVPATSANVADWDLF